MTRRTGLTLIEVLTAIFITGIGLLALLTLIPLGAMNMAQSGQDDRVGYIKENALAISMSQDFENDRFVTDAMTNPGGGLAVGGPSGPSGPSHPVFIDPQGQRANTAFNWQMWVGGQLGGMRRCSVDFLSQGSSRDSRMRAPLYNVTYHNQQLLKWCTLQDDMDFEREGAGAVAPGMPVNAPSIERTPRFSWAWVVRQSRSTIVNTARTQCVIYKGRTLIPNTGETLYPNCVASGPTSVTLVYDPTTQDKPNVQAGTWILDIGGSRGNFYRVVDVTESSATTLEVEVQTPLLSVPAAPATIAIAVLENVVEVTNPYP